MKIKDLTEKQIFELVEKDKSGQPILLSRYGYIAKKIDDKFYLVAASIEEAAEIISKNEGMLFHEAKEELEKNWPHCVYNGFNCSPMSGCKTCRVKYEGSGYYSCTCTKD